MIGSIRKLFGKRQKTGKRTSYAGAKIGRLTDDWITGELSADAAILNDYCRLRSRCRDLARNNPTAQRFLQIVEENLIGPGPFHLRNKARNRRGELDRAANKKIEEARRKWMLPENCTTGMDAHWHSVSKLLARAVATDGFTGIRLIDGADNEFGFAVMPFESDYLDTDYNGRAQNGNMIRMGVECDSLGRRVAYYLHESHPGDFGFSYVGGGRRVRVPADDILMPFVRTRPGQTIGVPWMSPIIMLIRQLDAYIEASVVGARIGASKMGFYEWSGEQDFAQGEDEEILGAMQEIEAGVIEALPKGYKFNGFDPNSPHDQFGDFSKAVLRQIASGLGVGYNMLANDLEGVNYSSLREGRLHDVDHWRSMQNWWVYSVEYPIYKRWLRMALLNGAIELSPSQFDKYCACEFQGRGWDWVDPQKEVDAHIKAIGAGIGTYSEAVNKRGRSFDDLVEELSEDEKILESTDLKILKQPKEGNGNGNDQSEASDDDEGDPE